jgi:hypothetical protein
LKKYPLQAAENRKITSVSLRPPIAHLLGRQATDRKRKHFGRFDAWSVAVAQGTEIAKGASNLIKSLGMKGKEV